MSANADELGLALISAGRIQEALAHYEAAVAAHPHSLDLLFNLARLLTDTGACERAMRIYETLVSSTVPPSPKLSACVGICLYKLGRKTDAVQWLQRSVSEDSSDLAARSVLLMARCDTGDLSGAIEDGRAVLAQKSEAMLPFRDLDVASEVDERIRKLNFAAIARKKCVVSISLWGDNPKYTDGIFLARSLVERFYPGWVLRLYHDETVPNVVLSALAARGTELVRMPVPANRNASRLWRFMVADDPEVGWFVSRDCDSPILPKEAAAVREWTMSGLPFHIMRDHPYHAELMLAGMWGGVAGVLPPLTPSIGAFVATRHNLFDLWIDQVFLAQQVWPYVKDHALVHDTYLQFRGRPLPEVDAAAEAGVDVPREKDSV